MWRFFVRKFLIAGNWKMHGSITEASALLENLKQNTIASTDVTTLVLPTFVHLQLAHELIGNASIKLGAQDLYPGTTGAFTGEVSGRMLKDIGCEYVLIGHSERRTILGESLSLVSEKFKAALNAGLKPILCIGETRAQREQGETESLLREQLVSVITSAGIETFASAVIAYEPVWAIGTGLTATPEEAQEVHKYIRQVLAEYDASIAKKMIVLYGGSMKADNAASLLAMPDIDGGLIGGASLDAAQFNKILSVANQIATETHPVLGDKG